MTPATDESWPMVEQAVEHLFAGLPAGHTPIGGLLAELGWSDIEAEYPVGASELLFRAQGRHLGHTDCLDRAMLAELSAATAAATAVVLPGPGSGGRPESTATAVSGIVVGPLRGTIVVPVLNDVGTVALHVVSAAELDARALNTFDPATQWTAVTGDLEASTAVVDDATVAWSHALGAANRGLATELNALTARMLEIATELASTRVQFGAPIGSFQALRHGLADAAALLQGATALVGEAWRFGGDLLTLSAKAAAGRAHRGVAAVALQTCGAIGLTAEHDLHRYVQRGFQIDSLFGSYHELEAELADRAFGAGPVVGGLPPIVTSA